MRDWLRTKLACPYRTLTGHTEITARQRRITLSVPIQTRKSIINKNMALSKQSAENLMTCSLCLEIYKEPTSLPCLHTYCKQCISDFITSRRNKTEKITEFRCPECRTSVKPIDPDHDISKWTDLLPRNVVMDIMINFNERTYQTCQACKRFNEKSDATVWSSSKVRVLSPPSLPQTPDITHSYLAGIVQRHLVSYSNLAGSKIQSNHS